MHRILQPVQEISQMKSDNVGPFNLLLSISIIARQESLQLLGRWFGVFLSKFKQKQVNYHLSQVTPQH